MAQEKTAPIAKPRSRSHPVNLDHQWQIDHIRQGLCEANAGNFASKANVKRVISRLRLKSV